MTFKAMKSFVVHRTNGFIPASKHPTTVLPTRCLTAAEALAVAGSTSVFSVPQHIIRSIQRRSDGFNDVIDLMATFVKFAVTMRFRRGHVSRKRHGSSDKILSDAEHGDARPLAF